MIFKPVSGWCGPCLMALNTWSWQYFSTPVQILSRLLVTKNNSHLMAVLAQSVHTQRSAKQTGIHTTSGILAGSLSGEANLLHNGNDSFRSRLWHIERAVWESFYFFYQ